MHKKNIFLFLTAILVIASVPVTLVLLKNNQSLRQEASTISETSKEMRVLVLEYYPRNPSNSIMLDVTETGISSTVQAKENYVDSIITNHLLFMKEATKFRGYKNANAPSYLDYKILDRKKFYTKIPQGYQLWWTTAKRPHYGQIMNSINICDYVNNQGVKEVWMFGYHSSIIEPDESRMASRHGDVSNSLPKENAPDYSSFKMPICNKTYTLYNFNYDRGGESMAHNLIHHVENIIPFTENTWPPTPQNIPNSIFWGDFSEYIQPSTIHNYRSSCGNAHYTPNWNSPNDSYIYTLTSPKESNCETWHPDNSKTTYTSTDCSKWGCTDIGFYKWFLQNIPGYNNCISHNGQYMRNWWDAVYDFDAFIDEGRTLYQNESNCASTPTATPTPTLSPTPTTTSTPTPSPTNVPITLECDNNDDDVINIEDYEIWISEMRNETGIQSDCDNDGIITIFDYAKWLAVFRNNS